MKYKVYIGSLPGNLRECDIMAYFSRIVSVRELILVKSKDSPQISKGYGFLTLETQADCHALLSSDHVLAGRKIKCEAMEKGLKLKEKRSGLFARRVFISNLPPLINNQEIEDFFSKFGSVESAYRIAVQSCKKLSGYGYVTFCEPEPAAQLAAMGKISYLGKVVEIKPYDQSKPGHFYQGKPQIGETHQNLTKQNKSRINKKQQDLGAGHSGTCGESTEESKCFDRQGSGSYTRKISTFGSEKRNKRYSTMTEVGIASLKPTSKRYFEQGSSGVDHRPCNLSFRVEIARNPANF